MRLFNGQKQFKSSIENGVLKDIFRNCFFVLCCFTSVACYIILPFNHVHMLIETVSTEKQVT